MPIGLKGLIISAIIAIIMSTSDSWLNACSTIIAHDILKKIYSLGYANLLVESGPNLLRSFLNNNLINDFYLFMAVNKINLKSSVVLNSFIDLLSKKFKKRSQINTFLDKEKLFRYQ